VALVSCQDAPCHTVCNNTTSFLYRYTISLPLAKSVQEYLNGTVMVVNCNAIKKTLLKTFSNGFHRKNIQIFLLTLVLSYAVANVEISAGDERGVGRLFWLTACGWS
jgi:hypothetical protein